MEQAEQRIDKLFCFLVINACGGISAAWCPLHKASQLLDSYNLLGIHVSSGFPILEKKQDEK